ncbi:hypothetical protein K435DRAFT_563978, partial [Dendrothele bispora CBS 962.96]
QAQGLRLDIASKKVLVHTHSLRRNRPRSFSCPVCPQDFTASHNLKYHLYAHLRIKPYLCERCFYRSSAPHTLKRHYK